MEPVELEAYVGPRKQRIDTALDALLPSETRPPAILHRGMRYAVLGPGKRLRPLLSLAAAETIAGEADDNAVRLGCAVELVHAYSLVHDDLPCMDDDDYRRGRPTTHKIFGEAMAVLIGDALQTIAFEVAASSSANRRFDGGDFAAALARAAGHRGMAAGQAADLEAEQEETSVEDVRFIHENKTSRLLSCAIELGAMAAEADDAALEALRNYGLKIGLAFQIVDDLLDVTGNLHTLGKEAGADAARGKATWPQAVGVERARHDVEDLLGDALRQLERFGRSADALTTLGRWIVNRTR
jgi:geranylgeranyl diphosphate synthase type II